MKVMYFGGRKLYILLIFIVIERLSSFRMFHQMDMYDKIVIYVVAHDYFEDKNQQML